jgi:hypothetical protein
MARALSRFALRPHLTLTSLAVTAIALPLLFLGCNPTPVPVATEHVTSEGRSAQYPPRPTTPPTPFHVFHTTDTSVTLVTTPTATDTQIEAIIYQLRDAAHAHTFDQLHISQKLVDARSPILWFHIYRGPQCASEKYTTGKLPCGPSYHAAGEYALGSFKDPQHDDGAILHGEDQTTQLWNPDAPYTAPQPTMPSQK